MEITELDQTWKGRKIPFHYVSSHHYAVRLTENPQCWELSLRREALEAPAENNFEDTLLEDYLEEPLLFGAFEGGELIGILELAAENWNNRLRVSNLWVREGWRRRGIGRQLMRKAEELAAMQGSRHRPCPLVGVCALTVDGFQRREPGVPRPVRAGHPAGKDLAG